MCEGRKVSGIQCWLSNLSVTCRNFSRFSESFDDDMMCCRRWKSFYLCICEHALRSVLKFQLSGLSGLFNDALFIPDHDTPIVVPCLNFNIQYVKRNSKLLPVYVSHCVLTFLEIKVSLWFFKAKITVCCCLGWVWDKISIHQYNVLLTHEMQLSNRQCQILIF